MFDYLMIKAARERQRYFVEQANNSYSLKDSLYAVQSAWQDASSVFYNRSRSNASAALDDNCPQPCYPNLDI